MNQLPESPSSKPLLQRRYMRLTIKILLFLLTTASSVVCFGLCVPLFLLCINILPHLYAASIIYLAIGGIFGLLFGAVTTAVSLKKSPDLITSYCAKLLSSTTLFCIFYLVCQMHLPRFRHL